MTEPLETAELLAFAKTVDVKSLSRAADELGVPRATISRRLARLEQRLGARLLRRTTRSLVLTDAGEALYRHARIVLDAVGHAEASVRRTDDAIRGELRVSVPPFWTEEFFEFICDFAATHPDVRMQVHFATRHVDLRRDGYDVAIRAASDFEPGVVARTLARVPVCMVASPEYLKEHGTPESRKDLERHRCLMGFARGELPQTQWPFKTGAAHIDGTLSTNSLLLLVTGALRGLGIALLPLHVVRPHLESGALILLLRDLVDAEHRIAVVYAEREFVPPQVRAFVDAAVKHLPTQMTEIIPKRCEEAEQRRQAKKRARK